MIPWCYLLRGVRPGDFDATWQIILQGYDQSRRPRVKNYGGSWLALPADHSLAPLRAVCEVICAYSGDIATKVVNSKIMLYVHDWRDLYRDLDQRSVIVASVCQRVNDRPAGVVIKPGSLHVWRSYFRGSVLEHTDATMLKQWLLAQDDVTLSSSLRTWCERTRPLRNTEQLQRHWFVDHDHAAWSTMANLVCDRVVRVTMPIQTK